jgi:glycerophosphoryl diester phosphodiesterase
MRPILTRGIVGWSILIMTTAAAVDAKAQLIIAHRGASHDAPENTLAAFKLAWEQNADGIEGDFYLTKDGKIICFHDKTTKRTAGGVDIDVASSTLEQLRKLDVGSWKDPKYAGEKAPTLDEVLAVVPPGKMFYIEIKCGPEILPALEETLGRSKVKPEQLRIISFNADVIAQAKQRLPKIKGLWISGYKQDKATGQWRPDQATILKTLNETKADGFNSNANFEMFTPKFVAQLKGMGLEVGAWTVDKAPDARKLKEMGVTAITTNRPGFIRQSLAQSSNK